MIGTIKTRYKKRHKGQINIAEVVVSTTIILILSVSIAQLGSRIAESEETNPIEKLKTKAQNALNLGVSTGTLRDLVYTVDLDNSPEKTYMETLIDSILPFTAQYSLIQKTINNTAHGFNNRILLGIKPIPSGNLNIFTVSVLISGYFDTSQIDDTPFIVTLIVALGDF
jgi:hypothetical protein